MRYLDGFRDPAIAQQLRIQIDALATEYNAEYKQPAHIMEVCGTHTMAIARTGIRSILPLSIDLISGPGCPVCVTDCGYIDCAIGLAERGVIIVTFGDMLKVPGSNSTLAACRADGGSVEVCYSPLDAVAIAKQNPEREVVFLAIGFETTVAPVISIIVASQAQGIGNVSLLTAFKTVPEALHILSSMPDKKLDAFLCPAHVSAIIGAQAYEPVVARHKLPAVIAGFEPLDILLGIRAIMAQLCSKSPRVENLYQRVVRPEGNRKAQELIAKYLYPADVSWRGLGMLAGSGLAIRDQYSTFDSEKRFRVSIPIGKIRGGCHCSEVLRGVMKPPECKLFGGACTPDEPVGPCMVSPEGSCSAYFKYNVSSQVRL